MYKRLGTLGAAQVMTYKLRNRMFMNSSEKMGASHQKAKTAILFDAENISYRHVEAVVKLAAKHGKPILRAYADFSKLQTKGWEKPALKHGIRTIHQFSYDGKNSSSDFLMMHDAFKLMHSGKIDTFVIVTCDKDFITPIQLLRQSGAYVHGMGLKDKTSGLLMESCNRFSILDESVTVSVPKPQSSPQPETVKKTAVNPVSQRIVDKVVQAYNLMKKDNDGWVEVGMLKQKSKISSKKFKKFSSFLKKSERFELSENNSSTRLIVPGKR